MYIEYVFLYHCHTYIIVDNSIKSKGNSATCDEVSKIINRSLLVNCV